MLPIQSEDHDGMNQMDAEASSVVDIDAEASSVVDAEMVDIDANGDLPSESKPTNSASALDEKDVVFALQQLHDSPPKKKKSEIIYDADHSALEQTSIAKSIREIRKEQQIQKEDPIEPSYGDIRIIIKVHDSLSDLTLLMTKRSMSMLVHSICEISLNGLYLKWE